VTPPRTLPLSLYAAATGLLEPFAPALLRRRARAGKEDVARLPERLGRASAERPPGALVWLHGVSVGESLSLLPLIAALKARRPALNLLVTSGTATSAQVLAGRLPAGVIHQFAPVDAPGAAARFLDHWRPDAALFVESELWPNLLTEAAGRGVRLALVSARMTEESARGWARAPGSARALLAAFDLILPQDEATARRLERLGARVHGRLNLKLLGEAPPVDAAMLKALRQAAGRRKLVAAVSTHPGEEPLIAEACRAAAAGRPTGALLLVAPRHPERGADVAATLAQAGLKVGRRSGGDPPAKAFDAYVLDTLGELGAVYAGADAVVMGGSFVDGIGGHNPLEAARLGAGVVTGPHVANARAIYDAMLAEAAVIEAADAAALARHIRGLLDNPAIARRIGEAAQDFAARQAAALEAAMALLEPLLPA
jgi:3-deoxy-D-manno-octulosonic-acid transferase